MVKLPNTIRDERNPGARHAVDLLDRESNVGQQDQNDAFEKEFGGENYDKDSETSGSEILDQREAAGANPMNYTGTGKPASGGAKGLVKKLLLKKRTGVFGLFGLVGIGGVILTGLFGSTSMLVNITENFRLTNDSSATALEQRVMKVFGFGTQETDPVCVNASKNIKCKMGRISNKALNQLEKRGIKPLGEGMSDRKKTGYPDKNPTSYEITLDDGSTRTVAANDFAGELAKPENRKIAARVLGVGGAINVRQKAWVGKYINDKLYSKFNLKRTGGLADGANNNKDKTPDERQKAAQEKLKERVPPADGMSEVKSGVSDKVKGRLEGAKKGGTAYTVAVAGCVAVKAPSYIAAGVAAVQLAQVLPVVMDVVLSPSSKAQASGFDSGFTSEDMDVIGSLLTNVVAGKSALDSKYLQSVMGVNTSKPTVSPDFTPGYAVMQNDVVKKSAQAAEMSEDSCNMIMSPGAMYTAMTVDLAVTAASSATIFGGIAKLAITLFIDQAVSLVLPMVVEGVADQVITDLAANDKIPNAQGEALGDVIGIGAAAFFSAGGMARHLPTLKTSQLTAFNEMKAENESFQREMAIASMSPFDISSKYTFLGSAVNTVQMSLLKNGGYTNPASALATIATLPFAALSPSAQATNFNEQNCNYADQFNMTPKSGSAPAINVAGLPCTGLTRTQSSMETDEAIELLAKEGWLSLGSETVKDISDTATIEDLMPVEGSDAETVIRKDTPLSDFINNCSDASTGDYFLDANGCVVSEKGGDTTGVDCAAYSCSEDEASMTPVGDSRALEAMSVFLLDYQSYTMINGFDEEESKPGSAAPGAAAGATIDAAALFEDSTAIACAPGTTDAGVDVGYNSGTAVNIRLCAIPNSFDSERGGPGLANSRVSGATYAMFEQIKADLGVETVALNDSFRTMAQQISTKAIYGAQAADPGYSNHQMGIAFDMGGGGCSYSMGVTSCSGNAYWSWLSANGATYGFKQLPSEWWHWSP